MPLARSPSPEVAFACGSRSMTSAALAGLGKARSEVDGSGRLADPALLVRDCVDRSPPCQSTQASGRFLATPARRGNPAGVGPRFAQHEQPGAGRIELAAEPAPRPAPTRSSSALGPTQRIAAPPGRDERQAPLGRDRRVRERLRDRDAEARPSPAPRPARARRARSAAPTRAGTSHLRRSPRAASPRDPAARARAGCPAAPPPEPTSTIGPSNSRDELERRGASRRAGHARASSRSRDRRQPGRRDDGAQPGAQAVRQPGGRRRSGSAPSPSLVVSTPA